MTIDAPMAVAGDAMVPLRYRVTDNVSETRDSVTITLAPVEREIVTPVPGQFAMLWQHGVGEVPISFSGIPAGGRLVHSVRAVGAVSSALCTARPGDVVGVRGPFGRGWPLEQAEGRDVVIVAGGIGLAPVRPVIDAVLAEQAAFGRLAVVVGAKRVHDLLYRSQIEQWWALRGFELLTTVDEPCSHWQRGSVGVVTSELRRVQIDGPNTVAMVCGPEVMMRAVGRLLTDRGIPAEQVHLSLERNMQCGLGWCGHCQLGGQFICHDGPVFDWRTAQPLLGVPEL